MVQEMTREQLVSKPKIKYQFSPAECVTQLRLRRQRDPLIDNLLTSYEGAGCGPYTAVTMLACYQSDIIHRLRDEIIALRARSAHGI